MLKKMFALSDKGARDLRGGIIATAVSHISLLLPVSLLMMIVLDILNVISGNTQKLEHNIWVYIGLTAAMFILVFIMHWIQYNKTYTVAYSESASRRITLAEKLRKLPLSFFGQRDLSDLTSTIMGDCTVLERVFSNAVPQFFGTMIMFIITAISLLIIDWRMGLCIVLPIPVAALIVFTARKAQTKAETANFNAKRAAYDGVQEYLDTIQELKSCAKEQDYLNGLAGGMMLSVDVAHALHPNRPEKCDITNQIYLNDGVALKLSGNQLYATDSEAVGIIEQLCQKYEIPYKKFANHSNIRGGSTLGSPVSSILIMKTIDVGIPMLAMHSSRETMGKEDQVTLCKLMKVFFEEERE